MVSLHLRTDAYEPSLLVMRSVQKSEKISECNKETSQSHTADQPMAP